MKEPTKTSSSPSTGHFEVKFKDNLEERISRLERIVKASLSQPSLISDEMKDL